MLANSLVATSANLLEVAASCKFRYAFRRMEKRKVQRKPRRAEALVFLRLAWTTPSLQTFLLLFRPFPGVASSRTLNLRKIPMCTIMGVFGTTSSSATARMVSSARPMTKMMPSSPSEWPASQIGPGKGNSGHPLPQTRSLIS